MTLLGELESVIADAAATHGPAVVGIDRRAGRGSGIVVAEGEVLTLASNLRDPAAEVAVVGGSGAGGAARTVTGTVAGIDRVLDLALLRVPTGEIEPLRWAREAAVIGQAVIALANPGGRGLRATVGFVAATGRSFRGPQGRVVGGALEHTAPLPPGSGGGPLLDADGLVLGLNAVRVHGGLILALPGVAVAERAGRLGREEVGASRELGVTIVSPRVAGRLRRAVGLPDRDGLLIHGVAAGSPADRALVRAGDLIVRVGDRPVDGVEALYTALDRVGPNGTLDVRVVRGVDEHEIVVSFGGER